MADIKLTLGDIPAAPDPAAAMAAQEKPAEEVKPAQPVFTAEEQQQIDEFSKKIDITNSALVFQYGAGTQQNIANFSDTALASVRSKDLGEVGDMISSLVVELRDFTSDEEQGRGFFGFLKKKVDKLQLMKARYDEAEVNVNKIVSELDNKIVGRHVVLVEDIIDSGRTIAYIKNDMLKKGVKSLKVCALLDKPDRRVSDVAADYVGFTIPDEFVVGYGLDFDQKYRNFPDIGVLKPEMYETH